MKPELLRILGSEHHLRILLLLRDEQWRRFIDIRRALRLNPAQADRALKFLREGLWIIPETYASGSRIRVRYQIGKRGKALLEALDAFHESARRNKQRLGPDFVEDLDALYA